MGDLVLKGRSEPLRAFESLRPEQFDDLSTEAYLNAFAQLESTDPDALGAFAAAVGRMQGDRLASFHLKRLLNGATGARTRDGLRGARRRRASATPDLLSRMSTPEQRLAEPAGAVAHLHLAPLSVAGFDRPDFGRVDHCHDIRVLSWLGSQLNVSTLVASPSTTIAVRLCESGDLLIQPSDPWAFLTRRQVSNFSTTSTGRLARQICLICRIAYARTGTGVHLARTLIYIDARTSSACQILEEYHAKIHLHGNVYRRNSR